MLRSFLRKIIYAVAPAASTTRFNESGRAKP